MFQGRVCRYKSIIVCPPVYILSLSSVSLLSFFYLASISRVDSSAICFNFFLSLDAISHNRPASQTLRSQLVPYADFMSLLSLLSRVSLTSSLLPLLLLSFLPSSSPLFHPCPHLTPFSSLFPPLFCCVYMAMKDAAFYPTLLRFKMCYRVDATYVIFSPFFPYFAVI